MTSSILVVGDFQGPAHDRAALIACPEVQQTTFCVTGPGHFPVWVISPSARVADRGVVRSGARVDLVMAGLAGQIRVLLDPAKVISQAAVAQVEVYVLEI